MSTAVVVIRAVATGRTEPHGTRRLPGRPGPVNRHSRRTGV